MPTRVWACQVRWKGICGSIAGTGGLVSGEGSLYKDIGVFSGNIKMKGTVERTLKVRFFERVDELTIEFTEHLD
jgi:hypothetical protein